MRKRIFHLTKPDFKKSRLLLTFLLCAWLDLPVFQLLPILL